MTHYVLNEYHTTYVSYIETKHLVHIVYFYCTALLDKSYSLGVSVCPHNLLPKLEAKRRGRFQ